MISYSVYSSFSILYLLLNFELWSLFSFEQWFWCLMKIMLFIFKSSWYSFCSFTGHKFIFKTLSGQYRVLQHTNKSNFFLCRKLVIKTTNLSIFPPVSRNFWLYHFWLVFLSVCFILSSVFFLSWPICRNLFLHFL